MPETDLGLERGGTPQEDFESLLREAAEASRERPENAGLPERTPAEPASREGGLSTADGLETPGETEPPAPTEEPAGRKRDPDTGRFVRSEEDTSREGEEQTPSTEGGEEGERLLAGKYKTQEELERAYRELESKLGQRPEVTQLEQRIQQMEQMLREAQKNEPETPAAPAYIDRETQSALDDLVAEEGGEKALDWVLHNRPELYQHALKTWASMSAEDAFAAARFDFGLQLDAIRDEQAKALEARTAPLAAQEQTQQFVDVFKGFASKNPEAATLGREMMAVMQESPLLAAAVASGDPTRQEDALRLMLSTAKAGQSPELARRAAETAREDAARQAQMRDNARTVTTAQTPKTKPTAEMTSEERQAEFARQILSAGSTSVADGLEFPK
jgi:hypothetical protein